MKANKFIYMLVLFAMQLTTAMGQGCLKTPWTDSVSEKPLNQYPRPSLIRDNWTNLNGLWEYIIQTNDEPMPQKWQGKILVPFAIESYLSGVQKNVGADEVLWYRKQIDVGKLINQRLIIHFGAIDWCSDIYINSSLVKQHKGGYTGFSIDATPYLEAGNNEILVKVSDPTDNGDQPRGKQVNKPGGIYYTSVTGIWQTVWYELVPETYLQAYTSNTALNKVRISPKVVNAHQGDQCKITVTNNGEVVYQKAITAVSSFEFELENALMWSPDKPNLYQIELELIRKGKPMDKVQGYFAFRDIDVKTDAKGIKRIYLNGKKIFLYGPLDQGYWPDGLYTAPTENALLSDIIRMKDMGFNSVRKHVKVEPERWYYHCDRLGLLVWQDMPSGYCEIVPVADHEHSTEEDWLDKHYEDVDRSYESEKQFINELQEMISQLSKHPSIGIWVPFNESWGQFRTNEILEWTKKIDPYRIVDGPSGWIDRNGGEFRDYHLYGERLKPLPLDSLRALVIGEFGGLGYHIKENSMSKDAWSYHGYKNSQDLQLGYNELIEKLVGLRNYGFAAAIYTQLTDVETEINGLITYDRKIVKVKIEAIKELSDLIIKANDDSAF